MGRIKTKKIKLTKLKGGSNIFKKSIDTSKITKSVNNELKERCQFLEITEIPVVEEIIEENCISESINKLNTTLELYNNNAYTILKVGYPDFHGTIRNIDYREVPENHILCFLTELGNLGLPYYNDTNSLNNFVNNLSKADLDLLMNNLALLNDTKQFNSEIYGNDIYINCFSKASWYFPGQKYINVSLSMDKIANTFYCKNFIKGFSRGVEDEDTYNKEMDISYFIEKIKSEEITNNNIYLYFFILCRPFIIEDGDRASIIKILQNEMIMNTINRAIMREYKGTFIETGLTLSCSSESQNMSGLVDPNIIDNYHSINKDQNYIYNRKSNIALDKIQSMMYFYNKVLTNFNKINKEDIFLFLDLSFSKQTFILRKFIKIGLNNDILRKLIYLLIKNYFINSKRLNYIYHDLFGVYLSFSDNDIDDFLSYSKNY